MFVVTEKWLREHTISGNAWNAKQLRALGIPCPAKRGWMSSILGKKISFEAKEEFEKAANRRPAQPGQKCETCKERSRKLFVLDGRQTCPSCVLNKAEEAIDELLKSSSNGLSASKNGPPRHDRY